MIQNQIDAVLVSEEIVKENAEILNNQVVKEIVVDKKNDESVKEKKEKPIPRLSKVWLKASDFVKKRDFKAAYNLILE